MKKNCVIYISVSFPVISHHKLPLQKDHENLRGPLISISWPTCSNPRPNPSTQGGVSRCLSSRTWQRSLCVDHPMHYKSQSGRRVTLPTSRVRRTCVFHHPPKVPKVSLRFGVSPLSTRSHRPRAPIRPSLRTRDASHGRCRPRHLRLK
jgi:hypothetical protein